MSEAAACSARRAASLGTGRRAYGRGLGEWGERIVVVAVGKGKSRGVAGLYPVSNLASNEALQATAKSGPRLSTTSLDAPVV